MKRAKKLTWKTIRVCFASVVLVQVTLLAYALAAQANDACRALVERKHFVGQEVVVTFRNYDTHQLIGATRGRIIERLGPTWIQGIFFGERWRIDVNDYPYSRYFGRDQVTYSGLCITSGYNIYDFKEDRALYLSLLHKTADTVRRSNYNDREYILSMINLSLSQLEQSKDGNTESFPAHFDNAQPTF